MSAELKEALITSLLTIIIIILVATGTYCVMQHFESPEWKEQRNRHRKYDPIKKEEHNYIDHQ